MSLNLLVDKSTLQSLSSLEARFLAKHYRLNIPPILLNEIIGDLSKDTDSQRPQWMSQRFSSFSAKINLDYKSLLAESLLGEYIPMTGQILIPLDKEIIDKNNSRILFTDEQAAERDIRRWRNGEFTNEEKDNAKVWREVTKNQDNLALQQGLKNIFGKSKGISTFDRLICEVNGYVTNARRQKTLLNFLLDIFGADESLKAEVMKRWDEGNHRILQKFAPYAFFCLKVKLVFGFGLLHNLVSTRSSNHIDLEYLYYLPFAQVFVTSDKLQAEMAKILLRENQSFIKGDDLKADLKQIANHWTNLSPEEQQAHRLEFGNYPPEILDSVTLELWEKHLTPRATNAGQPLPPEDIAIIKKEIAAKLKLIKEI